MLKKKRKDYNEQHSDVYFLLNPIHLIGMRSFLTKSGEIIIFFI